MVEPERQAQWLLVYFREHPAILISSVYIVASIVGLMFA